MYYRLTIDLIRLDTDIDEVSRIHVALTRGRFIEQGCEPEFHYVFIKGDSFVEFDIEDEDFDFDQAVTDSEGAGRYAYYPNQCLMVRELVDEIKRCGVDNIQVFPAIITDERTNEPINDYLVVNILDMISCANMDKSETDSLGDASYFHELVINEEHIPGLKMFRLTEYPPDVIVHEDVANAIRNKNYNGLILEPLKTKNSIG